MTKPDTSWLAEGLASLALDRLEDATALIDAVTWSREPYLTMRDDVHHLVIASDDAAAGKAALARLPALRAELLDRTRAHALREAISMIGGLSRPTRSAYTEAEINSWAAQAAEARAVADGAGADAAPTLALIAGARGVSLEQIAQTVSANAAAFSAIMVAEQQLRRHAETALAIASTPAEIAAALAAIKAQTDAKASELGV